MKSRSVFQQRRKKKLLPTPPSDASCLGTRSTRGVWLRMSDTRYFYFWCERCPTRITIETEVPSVAVAPEGEPAYSFAVWDGVGLARACEPRGPGDDGLVVADLCPACGSELHDLDDLMARGLVRLDDDSAEHITKEHAAWRARVGV